MSKTFRFATLYQSLMKTERAEEAHKDNLGNTLAEQRTVLRGTGPSFFGHLRCACQSLLSRNLYLAFRSSIYHRITSTAQVSQSCRLRISHRAMNWMILAELWYCQGLEVHYWYVFFSPLIPFIIDSVKSDKLSMTWLTTIRPNPEWIRKTQVIHLLSFWEFDIKM